MKLTLPRLWRVLPTKQRFKEGVAVLRAIGYMSPAMSTGTHDYSDDPRNERILVSVNGKLVPRADAVVSVTGTFAGLVRHKPTPATSHSPYQSSAAV